MLNPKIPVLYAISLLVVTHLLAYFIYYNGHSNSATAGLLHDIPGEDPFHQHNGSICTYKIARLQGYRYIHPLVYAEPTCESENLLPVKQAIASKISQLKASGVIRNASVYVRLFNKGEWISVEDQHRYSPGSLLKVPELITIMKMNEKNPGVLNTRLTLSNPITTNKTATYLSKSIEPGKSYTVKELLYYMIAHSDNNATYLLNQFMDPKTFKQVFTDLGLAEPDLTASEYKITARDFSVFLKVLFNASYLSINDSEFCTELLSKCDFKEGMLEGLPDDCTVAHKFGEGGDARTQTFNLSESGLVFCNDNRTYLVTIMTNGPAMKPLSSVISSISELVHQQVMTHFNLAGS